MKNSLLVLFAFSAGLLAQGNLLLAQAPATFVHPGALNNQNDLNFVKSKIAANQQPWIGKYNQLISIATATTNTTAPTSENGQKTDARKAYANALAWYYSGNNTYAQNAIGILNMWASTFAGYSPTVGQNQLQGAWIGALLGPAAEIMRSYSGWSSSDMNQVQNMFKTKFYPVLNTMSTWNGNVDLTQIDAMINIAVFCEDATEFNLALQRLNTRNPAYFYLSTDNATSRSIAGDGNNINAFWSNPSIWVNGLMQETCRDNGHHAQYAMASALHAAEVAWNQGVDVYTPNQARYTAALELLAQQIQTGLMQGTCSNNTTTSSLFATWEIGYNHYHNRKGISLPNTLQVLTNKVRPNGQSDWNIFFEPLTHLVDPPVTLDLNQAESGSMVELEFELELFPNPSHGEFTIHSWSIMQIDVFDVMGRKIESFETIGEKKFGHAYPLGMYKVIVTEKEKGSSAFTLLKNH
ncbi:MAG: alginate lyase family protein [Cytophagaceae bacterium]|jgi:hypothetical protein|nr:alginate lyase family protein [Cytophagaceae bacterium]